MTGEKIHIIGAGGVGMSGLALLAQRMGAQVSASDQNDSPYLRKLAEKGIRTWIGSQPGQIPAGARVFYSTAIRPDDAERSYAEKNGLTCESRHRLLAIITQNYFTIAIAGCHGKTTTSAWTARLLEAAGFEPTALIGGTVPEWNSNYREGTGSYEGKPLLVIEADESDRSFLSIDANVAMVTNVDLDHTDVHASLELLARDFQDFSQIALRNGGWLHVSREYRGDLVQLLHADDLALWEQTTTDPQTHSVAFQRTVFPVGLPGMHNLYNATLVLQLAKRLQINDATVRQVLSGFTGVNRRMQVIADLPDLGLSVIDDYAHHPHEVAATLAALAPRYERLLVFWEPHRLSRFNHFHREFDAALRPYAENGRLFSLPIFESGDRPADYPETAQNFEIFRSVPYVYLSGQDDYAITLDSWVGARTAAVFMGAGKSSDYAHAFVAWIRQLQK